MTMRKIDSQHQLAFPTSVKRERIFSNKGVWIDTKPVHIQGFTGVDESCRLLIDLG
uniref:Uncharacterized protein n=1 Tax=Utricularia reniformis TaxID=192314 RepID=A0A1Y0B1F5_9LAMI|nr:hypothetical protein AEK19_MT0997 [Utricularia reniformis]ART31221.1 hypothetical protein AEK19_MT0997 [Utricularia reniformis]